MIKFFRIIRQKIINEGRVSKYMLYAIGEIILVVIGILIALQISNSNELRKQRVEEEVILSGIKEDFIATRQNLLKTMKDQKKAIIRCRDLIDAIETKDYSIHPDTIQIKLGRGAFSHFREEAVMGSYDALIGSGKTSIISNQELLEVLADFSSQYKAGFEDQSKADNLFNLMMTTTADFLPALSSMRGSLSLKKEYSLEEKKMAINNLYENVSFLAYLLEKTKWENFRLMHHKTLLRSLNKVLYQFNYEEITPENESCHKYIGSYVGNDDEFIDGISYKEGSLFLKSLSGYEHELVQITSSQFSTMYWDSEIYFIFNNDSATGMEFQFIDKTPRKYEKVKN